MAINGKLIDAGRVKQHIAREQTPRFIHAMKWYYGELIRDTGYDWFTNCPARLTEQVARRLEDSGIEVSFEHLAFDRFGNRSRRNVAVFIKNLTPDRLKEAYALVF